MGIKRFKGGEILLGARVKKKKSGGEVGAIKSTGGTRMRRAGAASARKQSENLKLNAVANKAGFGVFRGWFEGRQHGCF